MLSLFMSRGHALFDMRLLRKQSKNVAPDSSKERRMYHIKKTPNVLKS